MKRCIKFLILLFLCFAYVVGGAQNDAGKCEKLFKQKKYKEAFIVCKQAAELGDPKAQDHLGYMYSNGQGVKQNKLEAAIWYSKAAEQGNAEEQFDLGVFFELGITVIKDTTEAIKWYRKAAEKGYPNAQITLARRYYEGKGIAQNYVEALKWYRKAAEQGFATAQLILGLMYEQGQGVQQNNEEAVKWYRRAAEQGIAYAQFYLALMYNNGQDVTKNDVEAVKWFRRAAEQGIADAQFNLGVMYANGQGVLTSGAAAADWYYKAGVTYLKNNKRADALLAVERIKNLQKDLHLNVPNAFLADKLLAQIYGNQISSKDENGVHPKTETSLSLGTGWPIQGGFVVTNHHVVAGHAKILLILSNGLKLSGTVAIDDPINDLVLIRVKNAKKLPPALPLAKGSGHSGSRVFTIGYPHADFMGTEAKITDGIINAVTGLMNDPRTYQISVPLQSGNSGGPLLNMRGEVIGVTTSKLKAAEVFKWTGDLPQNVNYAVKSGYLLMLLSSVSGKKKIAELPPQSGTLEQLAERIKPSVIIVVAE